MIYALQHSMGVGMEPRNSIFLEPVRPTGYGSGSPAFLLSFISSVFGSNTFVEVAQFLNLHELSGPIPQFIKIFGRSLY